MDEVFLVCWIDDNPIQYGMESREAITDGNVRALPTASLIGMTISMNWNRRICNAKILTAGTRALMKKELINRTKNASSVPDPEHTAVIAIKSKPKPSVKNPNKKTRMDAVLETITAHEETDEDKDKIIEALRNELLDEKEKHKKTRDDLEKLQGLFDSMESDTADIGNNVYVKKSVLAALKAVSGTVNVYARHVFKHVFETHEVVGRSLMGKPSNAFKNLNLNPAVNEAKRDAVINHALSSFNIGQGSQYYQLALVNLKHSLGNLVAEINKEARKVEQTVNASVNVKK